MAGRWGGPDQKDGPQAWPSREGQTLGSLTPTARHCWPVGTGSPTATQQIAHWLSRQCLLGRTDMARPSSQPHPTRPCPCHRTPHAGSPLISPPREKPSAGDSGGPLRPHHPSPPWDSACVPGGHGTCCPPRCWQWHPGGQGGWALLSLDKEGCQHEPRSRCWEQPRGQLCWDAAPAWSRGHA